MQDFVWLGDVKMNSAKIGERPPLTPPMLHDVEYYKKEGQGSKS